jgi:hypothetical protein
MSVTTNFNFSLLNEALIDNAMDSLKLNTQKQVNLLKKKFSEWKKLKGSRIAPTRTSARSANRKGSLSTKVRLNKAEVISDEIIKQIDEFKDFMKLEVFLLSMTLRDTKGKVIPLKKDLKKYLLDNGELNVFSSNASTIKTIKANPEFNRIYFTHLEKLEKMKNIIISNKASGIENFYKDLSDILNDIEANINVTMKNNSNNNSLHSSLHSSSSPILKKKRKV